MTKSWSVFVHTNMKSNTSWQYPKFQHFMWKLTHVQTFTSKLTISRECSASSQCFLFFWDYPFSMYAKFSQKFLTPWYAHIRVCMGVRNVSFSKNFVCALSEWSLCTTGAEHGGTEVKQNINLKWVEHIITFNIS